MTNILVLTSMLFTNQPAWVTFDTSNGVMRALRTVVERRTLQVEQVLEERFDNLQLMLLKTNSSPALTNMTKTLKSK